MGDEKLTAPTTRGGPMAYVINCDCGYVVRGETEDELVAGAEQHIREAHPDMVGKVSREDFLAMAEEQ
jgi:predicted small metal-binding protein